MYNVGIKPRKERIYMEQLRHVTFHRQIRALYTGRDQGYYSENAYLRGYEELIELRRYDSVATVMNKERVMMRREYPFLRNSRQA
jgi:hypothetical protein